LSHDSTHVTAAIDDRENLDNFDADYAVEEAVWAQSHFPDIGSKFELLRTTTVRKVVKTVLCDGDGFRKR
jgi:hypothetical protein